MLEFKHKIVGFLAQRKKSGSIKHYAMHFFYSFENKIIPFGIKIRSNIQQLELSSTKGISIYIYLNFSKQKKWWHAKLFLNNRVLTNTLNVIKNKLKNKF